jgi:hypothetical protein
VLQRYKLRLGDGTVLAVDHDGLSVWQADRKVLVQQAGSRHWKPLKEFLAQERAAARRAARLQPKPPLTSREALPLIPPPPRRRDGPDASRRRRASPSLRTTAVGPSPAEAPPEPGSASRPARPVEPPTAAPAVLQPLAEAPASAGAERDAASPPADEDVDWMALPEPGAGEPPANAISWHGPLDSASASGRVSQLQATPLEARPPQASALESGLTDVGDHLAHRGWGEARRRLSTFAVSASRALFAVSKSVALALLTLWKSLAREELPLPSLSPHGPASSRTPGSEPSRRGTSREREVYRPRRSPADGLPLLQLEPSEDEDLPTLELEEGEGGR